MALPGMWLSPCEEIMYFVPWQTEHSRSSGTVMALTPPNSASVIEDEGREVEVVDVRFAAGSWLVF